MIPFYKVFSLVMRVFSKPLVTYTKQYHLSKKRIFHEHLRRFFIFLGKKYNFIESLIKSSALKHASSELQKVKPITEEAALEKGVEFFYEIILYSILLSFPLYEMNRNVNDSSKKEENLEIKLNDFNDDIKSIHRSIEDQTKHLDKKITFMKESIENHLETLKQNAQKLNDEQKANRKIIFSSFLESNELINQISQEKIDFQKHIVNISKLNYDLLRNIQNE